MTTQFLQAHRRRTTHQLGSAKTPTRTIHLTAAVLLAIGLAGCGSVADDAPQTNDARQANDARPTDDAPAVTTVAGNDAQPTPSSVPVAPSSTTTPAPVASDPPLIDHAEGTGAMVDGRAPATAVFSMVDGNYTFTISTVTEPSPAVLFDLYRQDTDGATAHWGATTALVSTPNASGHHQIDGLDVPASEPDPALEAANESLVADYLHTALVENRWEDVDRFFDDGRYILHGPLFTDGLESVRTFFVGLRDAGTPFTYSNTPLLIAGGRHVLAISTSSDATMTTVFWDLWRIDDNHIVEHWDLIETGPTEEVNASLAGLD